MMETPTPAVPVRPEAQEAFARYVAEHRTVPSQRAFEKLLPGRDRTRVEYRILCNQSPTKEGPMIDRDTTPQSSTPPIALAARDARTPALLMALQRDNAALHERIAAIEAARAADAATVTLVRNLIEILSTDQEAWELMVQILRSGSQRNDSGALLNALRQATGRLVPKPHMLR